MFKTVDLFCGAGGLSFGFEATGHFQIVAAAEINKDARKTYIANHKGGDGIEMIPDVRGYDFRGLSKKFGGIDVVIGGPPCQGFSNANRQKNHIISMNNSLVKEYFRAVREIRPKAFIMENVSMLSSDTHRFYDSYNKKNKVKYNLKNVHYALLNIDEAGNVSYGTPVPIPGAVSIGLDANGEPSNFYADGYAYYTISNNMGYEGDLEIAMVPESFRVDVLKEQLDDNKVLVENANVETANFALLFEFDGDIKKIRHVLYKCAASRPSIESQTNEDEIEVQTETLSLKATPLANGFVKAKTGDDTTDAVYQDWYKAVYMTSTTTNTESGVES